MSPGQLTLIVVFGTISAGLLLAVLPSLWRDATGWLAGWWP